MSQKRRIYLINPKFQLKFSLIICCAIFISTLIYPITVLDLYDSFTAYIQSQSGNIPDAAKHLEQIESTKLQKIVLLMAIQFFITAIIFILGIFFSHKIAGPLFKLTTYFKKVKNGQLPGKLHFRQGDYFPELADEFNKSFGIMYERHQQDFACLSEINSFLNNLSVSLPEEKKVILKEIHMRLEEIQQRYTL